MSDVRSEIGRKAILAMLRDYDWTFGLECARCPNPNCRSTQTRVLNIRHVGEVDRRRRECLSCTTRWTTYEKIAPGKAARIIPKGCN